MSLLAAQLEPRMTTKEDGRRLVVVNCTRKITIRSVSDSE